MRQVLLAAVIALTATQAQPAAWPRGAGHVFVSLKYDSRWDRERLALRDYARESRISAYAEFGVSERLTFGGEIARSGPEIAPITEMRGFVRYAFLQAGSHVASAEIGAGRRGNEWEYEVRYLRPGLAWGRGFDTRWGSGWAEVEAASEIYDSGDDPAFKLDATVGLNLTDRYAAILQARSGDYPGGDAYVQLAPSVAVRLTENLRLQAELQVGVLNDTGVGGALAAWIEF